MNSGTMKSIVDAGAAVASELGNAATGVFESGVEMATSAGREVGAVSGEVEDFVRRNPFAAVGGALVAGFMIGLITRKSL